MGYPLGKNVNPSTFWTSCFYSLEKRFFFLEYRKRHFPGLYYLKKKVGKMAFFWSKTMGYPLGKKANLSTFWTSCFYGLEKRFFVLEYRKRHFPGLYYLKKKSGKMAIFGAKPWVIPLGKMSIFSTFWISCFYGLERRFFYSRISEKRFSWAILPKKNWKNGHFWTKTMG